MLLKPGEQLQGAMVPTRWSEPLAMALYGYRCFARATPRATSMLSSSCSTPARARPRTSRSAPPVSARSRNPDAGQLSRIVHGIELIERDPDLFFVMELVQGLSLRKVFDVLGGRSTTTSRSTRNRHCRRHRNLRRGPAPSAPTSRPDYLPRLEARRTRRREMLMTRRASRDSGTAFCAKSRKVTQGLGTEGYAPPETGPRRGPTSPSRPDVLPEHMKIKRVEKQL